jgi:UDP-2-acetamido-2-deoxy-ribo-hexuluronate aminotransferase
VACSSTVADRIRELRNHGSIDKVSYRRRGLNSRLDELQAAILRVKLTTLADRVRARQRNAETYIAHLDGLPIEPPVVTDDRGVHGYNYFTLQTDDRDALASYLQGHGIATAVYYRTPIHLLEAYRELGYAAGDFPVAERASDRVLSLPCHPSLTSGDIAEIANMVRRYYQ